MAKRRQGSRRNSRFRAVRYSVAFAIGGLASFDVFGGTALEAATSRYRLVSLDYNAGWLDIQAVIDGGMTFGVAHGDYTDTEIEECLEAGGSIDEGDLVLAEQANRRVRILGQISPDGEVTIGQDIVFNNGVQKRVKLNWVIPEGDVLKLWVWNTSGVVWTTGSQITMQGNAYVVFT